MENELKPCPFCGSTDVEQDTMNSIKCYQCGLSAMWTINDEEVNDEEMVALWNKRKR